MGQLRKLAKHTSRYLAGRAAMMMLGFVSFPLFTRVFSVEQYGAMSLIANIVQVFSTLAKMGMQHSVQRFHRERLMEGDLEQAKRYHSTLFVTCALLGLAIVAGVLAGTPLLPNWLFDSQLKKYLLIAAPLIFIRAFRSMITNLLQAESRSGMYNAVEIATKALTIAAACVLLFRWQRTVVAFYVGMVFAEAVVILPVVPLLFRRGYLSLSRFDPGFSRLISVFGLPMMWAELSTVVLDSGDRILVDHYNGPTALGYYSAAYGIATYVFELLVTPLNLAFFPVCMDIWTSRGEAETKQFLSQSFRLFFGIVCAVLCVVTLTSQQAIVILASAKYQPGHRMVPMLVAALLISAFQVFFRAGLMILKKPGSVAVITMAAAILNVALNIVLLPRIGVNGAAIATLVSYVFWVLSTAIISMRSFPIELDFLGYGKYAASAFVVVMLGSQLHAASATVELLMRGFFGFLAYALLVALIDPKTRHIVGRLRELVMQSVVSGV